MLAASANSDPGIEVRFSAETRIVCVVIKFTKTKKKIDSAFRDAEMNHFKTQ